MKKELSWKLLIPLGLILWLLGKFVIGGSVLTLIGFIVGIMGIINIFKKKK